MASLRGHTEIVKDLIRAGANLEAIDNEGKTSLIWAYRKRNKEIVELPLFLEVLVSPVVSVVLSVTFVLM